MYPVSHSQHRASELAALSNLESKIWFKSMQGDWDIGNSFYVVFTAFSVVVYSLSRNPIHSCNYHSHAYIILRPSTRQEQRRTYQSSSGKAPRTRLY